MDPSTSSIFDGLNEAQKKAVMTTEGPLLIVAGPGTGKTLTIVRRIAHLVQQGAKPENILAVTFTNRAAREMKERIEALLGAAAHGMIIGTFHLLGYRIIRGSSGADPTILGRDEQIEVLRAVMDASPAKAREAAEKISRVKNFLEGLSRDMTAVYQAYQEALRQQSAVDFDDLILAPLDILQNDPENRFKHRFTHIIVDEYQDINPAQYRLLKLLANNTGNICAVGDSDQAIYAFRGADIGNFLNFGKDFPGANSVTLTENYRSTAAILAAANALIRNNRERLDKDLVPRREEGVRVQAMSAPDDRAEAENIVQEIEARMGGTSHHQMRQSRSYADYPDRSFRFSDFGVIYRTNAQAKALEEAFSASGIPFQVIGRKGRLQSEEIAETLAYLRSLARSDGTGEGPRPDAQEAKLLSEADYFDPRAEAVALMTLHMAKGLEFPVVFIAGVEEGLIPCTIMKDGVDIEEERRLFYVGMTRAKDELVLLSSRKRFLYGQRLTPPPSPFLGEIPADLIANTSIPEKIRKQKEPDPQMGLF